MGVSCSQPPLVMEHEESDAERKTEQMQQLMQPRSGETTIDRNKRKMAAIRLVSQAGQPELWLSVSRHFLSAEGHLVLDHAVAAEDLPHVQYLLDSSAAKHINALGLQKCNFHGPTSAAALFECLTKASFLQKLTLPGCYLSDEDMSRITPALSCMSRLTLLQLSNNYLDDAGAAALTHVAVNMRSLTELIMFNNNITEAGKDRIRDIASQKSDMWLTCIDLQYSKAEGRAFTLEDWRRRLGYVRSLSLYAESRGGKWLIDLRHLKAIEQQIEDGLRPHVQRDQ